ncbi:General transcription factor II-I repeat domain-containing protein 2A [Araneus ventricosus]|uniref:General transcription factor II-I repeat domain-containing protein 2A n=1 Tax=Araneus ventricosus TaxID=182803 RepID=A0A4Y2U3Y6_ARAVE|nr:General transcription factor II-I repeat domain-containing protein 2A [Araneus ventricosus]
MSSQGPKEELLGFLPFSGQTRGKDTANAVQKCLEDNGIDINKIVSIATDGTRSMAGIHRGVISILQKKINHEILTFHCIIHQEGLCAQTFPAEIVEVMNLVIKIIKRILAKALYHRQFKDFLEEIDSQFSDLLLYNKVRWLSRCNVLQRFVLCLSEIKTFLNEKSINHPELEGEEWLQKCNLRVDTTMKLSELNLILQGKANPAYTLLEEVCFDNKLLLFVEDMESVYGVKTAAVAGAAVVATPVLVSAAGFGAGGIAAGSVATGVQATWFGGTIRGITGGMFAGLQSIGAAGLGAAGKAAIESASSATFKLNDTVTGGSDEEDCDCCTELQPPK